MKQKTITLTTVILLVFLSIASVAQIKTTIPNEIHLQQNPFRPMNILLIPTNIESITAQQGDLVMAFDGETCVGAAIIKDVNKVLNLVATSTDEVNKGYKSGEQIRLEYHSTFDNTVYDLTPEKILLGSMNFEELGTLYADFKASALGINVNDEPEIKVYPNPVSQQLHIVLGDKSNNPESINLRLINLNGGNVISKQYNTGETVINLDVSSLPTGEYTLVLANSTKKYTKKIIKK